MRFPRSARFALPAAVAIAVTLTGCGSSSGTKSTATETVETIAAAETTAGTTPVAAPVAVDTAFNDGDVTFAQGMIPHHQQAVEMADIALDRARKAGPAVIDLATRIKGAQGPEISLMNSWLTAWNQPVMAGMKPGETMPPGATHPPSHDMGSMDMGAMGGMMSAADMTALAKATGPEFDKMWLTMMVKHHEGAITMSKTVQTAGQSAEVKTLAVKIITSQKAEIDEMNKLVAG